MNVSFSDLYFKLESCGVEASALNNLYFEQALEPFIAQKFSVEEFMEELLAEADFSDADYARIRAVVEPYDGAKVYTAKKPLSSMIQSASDRSEEVRPNFPQPVEKSRRSAR